MVVIHHLILLCCTVFKIVEKRKGDVEDIYADVKLARKELGWTVERVSPDSFFFP